MRDTRHRRTYIYVCKINEVSNNNIYEKMKSRMPVYGDDIEEIRLGSWD